MAHEFTEYEPEMEPESASARGGGPPRKHRGIGVLDSFPPKRPPGPIPTVPPSMLFRIFAALLLLALASAILLLLFGK